MKKEPTFIAFSTQKGGAGKTTLTVLMASYLYYVRGYDVVVVDCDFPQFSIKDMRERDMQSIESNEYLLRQTHEMMKSGGVSISKKGLTVSTASSGRLSTIG